MADYHRLVFRLPRASEDLLSGLLAGSGTMGVEWREDGAGLRAEAYFSESPGAVWRSRVADDLASWGVELVDHERVPETDWLAEYRRWARPFPVGERLWIDPREPEPDRSDPEPPAGRSLLRIPARRAFGTGGHESTRLVLEMLEGRSPSGLRVLDVGTGSGVLAFACLLWQARGVVAFDVDAEAVLLARRNAALNSLEPRFFCGRIDALADRAFDLVLVNIIPELIAAELPRVVARVAPAGELCFSGIVLEREGEVLDMLAGLGLRPLARRAAGEWVALWTRTTA